jgi:hypothetical protein
MCGRLWFWLKIPRLQTTRAKKEREKMGRMSARKWDMLHSRQSNFAEIITQYPQPSIVYYKAI